MTDFPGAKPPWWASARRALGRRDARLAGIMSTCRGAVMRSRGDPFQTLARSVVGQQISVKAAQSVWSRLVKTAGEAAPGAILAAGHERLRTAGLSARKAEYIMDLAGRFDDGRLDPARWQDADDESVIADLVRVRGIGRWTAEMFLMFNLQRPDVFPVDDLGLQKAMRLHYFSGRDAPPQRLVRLGESWRPWRTLACWYLWRSLDPVPVEY